MIALEIFERCMVTSGYRIVEREPREMWGMEATYYHVQRGDRHAVLFIDRNHEDDEATGWIAAANISRALGEPVSA